MLQLTFQLNPKDKLPLYEQLYNAIATQIRTGVIAPNTRLPGKRSLANELSVSVNTVDTAYQILTAEGYLESRARSGFFTQEYREILPFSGAHARANAQMPMPSKPVDTAQPTPSCTIPPTPQATPPRGAPQHKQTDTDSPPEFDLSSTGIDPTLFPFRTWGRIQKELLYAAPELLLRGDAQGDANLRDALADYLAAFRGVRCRAEQIVVGAGMEYLLSLLAPLLPSHGGVENPGYARAKAVLENNGRVCTGLPLDEKGLSVTALQASGAGFCYVTPSHQYPTGLTMPVGRRAELLHWATAQVETFPHAFVECVESAQGVCQNMLSNVDCVQAVTKTANMAVENPVENVENSVETVENHSIFPNKEVKKVEKGMFIVENSVESVENHPQDIGARTNTTTSVFPRKTVEPLEKRYIIEDDYDSEFRFDVRPLPSLQGMAGADETVIYLATFSKSLAPSIRIAAMVLPEQLLQAWQVRYGRYASTVSRFEQQTLCRFLQEGYFTRHLARARGIYKARRNALVQALEQAFGKENIRLRGVHTGLHLLLEVPHAPSEREMVARCASVGVKVSPLSRHYEGMGAQCPRNTILLGYGGLKEQDAVIVAKRMAEVLKASLWEGGVTQ